MRLITEEEAKKAIENRPQHSTYESVKKTSLRNNDEFIFVKIYLDFKLMKSEIFQQLKYEYIIIDEFCYILK